MPKNTYGNEQDPDVAAFLEEVIALQRKHGFLLSHEDGHGAFEVLRRTDAVFPERYEDWLRQAVEVAE